MIFLFKEPMIDHTDDCFCLDYVVHVAAFDLVNVVGLFFLVIAVCSYLVFWTFVFPKL